MTTLVEQLRRTFAFFAPANLARLNVHYAPPEGDTAVVIIDVQKKFCDPRGRRGNQKTQEISERIQKLAPAFRAAGVPTYVVYFARPAWLGGRARFYKFRPEKGDIKVRKYTDSAFDSGKLKDLLKSHGRKNLLVCGFNASACVYRTARDAKLNGFNVTLMEDLTGNDNRNPETLDYALRRMLSRGIGITTSAEALAGLSAPKQPGK